MTEFDRSNVRSLAVQSCAGRQVLAVGTGLQADSDPSLDARHEAWLRSQYAMDLQVLSRCEEQIERQAADIDFFGMMGELHAGRAS